MTIEIAPPPDKVLAILLAYRHNRGQRPAGERNDDDQRRAGWLRWHEISVYRLDTRPERFLAHIHYGVERTKREYVADDLMVKDGIDVLLYSLYRHDPLEHLLGWPNFPKYNDRQRRLRHDLAARYQLLVDLIKEDLDKLGLVPKESALGTPH